MPFMQQEPRSFTRETIENLNPDQYGVYGLFRRSHTIASILGGTDGEVEWIYVGMGDVRERLLDHINGGNSCITQNTPTHWVAEVTANADARERELILELSPVCNRRVG